MPLRKVNLENKPIPIPDTITVTCQVHCTDCIHILYNDIREIKGQLTKDGFNSELKKIFERPEFSHCGICPSCYGANRAERFIINKIENDDDGLPF